MAQPPAALVGVLQLDGTNSSVDLGTNGVLLGQHFSQEAWIQLPPGSDTGWGGILGGYAGEASKSEIRRAPSLYVRPGAGLHGGFGDGTNWHAWNTPERVLTPGRWQHVAATYDGKAYLIYVDGELVLTQPLWAKPLPTPVRWIGRVNSFFPGRIADVRLWNVTRSPEQIRTNRFARLTGREQELTHQ